MDLSGIAAGSETATAVPSEVSACPCIRNRFSALENAIANAAEYLSQAGVLGAARLVGSMQIEDGQLLQAEERLWGIAAMRDSGGQSICPGVRWRQQQRAFKSKQTDLQCHIRKLRAVLLGLAEEGRRAIAKLKSKGDEVRDAFPDLVSCTCTPSQTQSPRRSDMEAFQRLHRQWMDSNKGHIAAKTGSSPVVDRIKTARWSRGLFAICAQFPALEDVLRQRAVEEERQQQLQAEVQSLSKVLEASEERVKEATESLAAATHLRVSSQPAVSLTSIMTALQAGRMARRIAQVCRMRSWLCYGQHNNGDCTNAVTGAFMCAEVLLSTFLQMPSAPLLLPQAELKQLDVRAAILLQASNQVGCLRKLCCTKVSFLMPLK